MKALEIVWFALLVMAFILYGLVNHHYLWTFQHTDWKLRKRLRKSIHEVRYEGSHARGHRFSWTLDGREVNVNAWENGEVSVHRDGEVLVCGFVQNRQDIRRQEETYRELCKLVP